MSKPTDPVDLSGLPSDTYIVIDTWGNCRRCGRRQDLRMGVCRDCADKCLTEAIGGGKSRCWDEDNPANSWIVGGD